MSIRAELDAIRERVEGAVGKLAKDFPRERIIAGVVDEYNRRMDREGK